MRKRKRSSEGKARSLMEPHSEKILAKGNEAIAMAAIDSGCLLYFGYPITPQNDIPEYLSKHLPPLGGEFIQAESEIASINLLLGASATGARAMTSSSSPGISLMQEGISYLAGSELPGLIVNISRSGPGLGESLPLRETISKPHGVEAMEIIERSFLRLPRFRRCTT